VQRAGGLGVVFLNSNDAVDLHLPSLLPYRHQLGLQPTHCAVARTHAHIGAMCAWPRVSVRFSSIRSIVMHGQEHTRRNVGNITLGQRRLD